MTTTRSDLDGVQRLGAAAHALGRTYWDCPFYFIDAPMDEWIALCSAWAAGWLEADGGRDRELAQLLNRQML